MSGSATAGARPVPRTASVPARRRPRNRRGPLFWAGYVLLLVWTVATLLPFVSMLLLSFHSTADIYANPLGFTGAWLLDNYVTAWEGSAGGAPIATYLLNSALVAVLAVGMGTIAGTLAGYGLARVAPRLGAVISRLMVVSLSIPLVVTLIPIFGLLGSLTLLNSPFGIALVYAAFMTPTITLIMRSVFGAVPGELLEAARLDGCTELSALWRVVLPLVRGGVTSCALLGLIFAWGEVQFAVVLLSRPQNQTLAVGLLSFQGEFVSQQGAFFAGLVMATGPIVILFVALQRFVTRGVTLGAFR